MANALKTRHGAVINIHEDEDAAVQKFDDDSEEEVEQMDESGDPLEDSGCTRAEDSDEDDDDDLEDVVAEDMRKFEQSFRGISSRYRLVNRIGEGTFSTVYKAEDLEYDRYRNDWDIEEKENKKFLSPSGRKHRHRYQRQHYVAIKKIYVTSSPMRIMNELDLLHDLRNCDSICPLITAFRHYDQVIAILPYFRHLDFRIYFREMSVADMKPYFRSLFTALEAVHQHDILHRDIKPTNFLYDTRRKRGVLVDFGLAERQGTDSLPCMCQLDEATRNRRYHNSYYRLNPSMGGYPTEDRRSHLRANRAGTRGFRAPEVLFKCTAQTTAIDIWSAGIILLTILSKRFPFFNSADDIDAVIELASVFGRTRMKDAAVIHGQAFDTNIPTISENGHSFEKIILWSTDRNKRGPDGQKAKLPPEEDQAIQFLRACLELNPQSRISATQALMHPFLAESNTCSEDEMDDLCTE